MRDDPLVKVADLDVERVLAVPAEAYPVLLVDANLPSVFGSGDLLELIAGGVRRSSMRVAALTMTSFVRAALERARDPVPVDPDVLDKRDVVVDDEAIHRREQPV
jgi:hypothetical protein